MRWRPGTNQRASGEAAVIKIDGSSTVFPITEAVAEEFQREKARQGPRHCGNLRHWRRIQEVRARRDRYRRCFAADSRRKRWPRQRPMASSIIELPIAFDALTVVVNPQNTWVDFHDRCGTEESSGSPTRRERSHIGTRFVLNGPMKRSRSLAQELTQVLLTTSPKLLSESRKPAAATTQQVKMTTFWSRVSRETSSLWVISLTRTSRRTATG